MSRRHAASAALAAVACAFAVTAPAKGGRPDPSVAKAVRSRPAALSRDPQRLRVDVRQSPAFDLRAGHVTPDAVLAPAENLPVGFHALQRVLVTRVQPLESGGWLLYLRPADYRVFTEEEKRSHMADDYGDTDWWQRSSSPAMRKTPEGWKYSPLAEDLSPISHVVVEASDAAQFKTAIAHLLWLDGAPTVDEVKACLDANGASEHPALAKRRCGEDGPSRRADERAQ